jgi:hypothetical protein
MVADKTAPQGDGMLAVPRIWLSYRAFERFIAYHAGTALFWAAQKAGKSPEDLFHSVHSYPPRAGVAIPALLCKCP